MQNLSNTFGFGTFVNVDIKVVETETHTIKKHVVKHNKATRNMIKGFLRFLQGRFNGTYENSKPEYADDAKNYIPCYISFGDGGIQYDENNEIIYEQGTAESAHIPDLLNWDTTVSYTSSSLVRELDFLSMNRSKIRKEENTIDLNDAPAGDMDTVVFYCEVGPGELNQDIQNNPRIITELGLFSTKQPTENDLLAYIKLGNYTVGESERKTNTLYVRPGNTVIITWYITVVAMSDVSVVDSSEELLEPELGVITFEND